MEVEATGGVDANKYLASNGSVDIRGRPADKRKTGGWKATPFIIVNEVAERMAFYAIAVNMVTYLVREMHQPLPDAATHTSDWIGAAFILTILGAFLADAYLGRFWTIVIFSCIYAVGMIPLTLAASIDSLRHHLRRASRAARASRRPPNRLHSFTQHWRLYFSSAIKLVLRRFVGPLSNSGAHTSHGVLKQFMKTLES